MILQLPDVFTSVRFRRCGYKPICRSLGNRYIQTSCQLPQKESGRIRKALLFMLVDY